MLLEVRCLCAGMVTGSWPPAQPVFRLWFQYEFLGLKGQSSCAASSVSQSCLSYDTQMCLLDKHSNEKKRNVGFLLWLSDIVLSEDSPDFGVVSTF